MKRLPQPWRTPVYVFLITRIMASASALLALSAIPARATMGQEGYTKPAYGKLMELFIGCWERSDGLWYLGIAHSGYTVPASHAFMPLYPMLIRAVSTVLPFPSIVAALLISNIAFLFGLYFVYQLAWNEFGDEAAASRSLWYLALFPGSLFFLAPYTEALFLCLAAGSLWSARKGRWALASLLGCLLAVSRNLGIGIGLPLAIEFYFQWRQGRTHSKTLELDTSLARPKLRQLLWLGVLPLGVLLWVYYCATTTGDPLISIHQQSQWQRSSVAPWKTFYVGLKQAWDYSTAFPGGGYVLEAIAVLGASALGLIGLLFGVVSLPLSLFIWIGLIPPLMAPYDGRMLMSCTRFVAVLFPVFMILGKLVKKDGVDQAIRTCFIAIYGIAVAMYVANQYLY